MSHQPPIVENWTSGGEPYSLSTAHIEGETQGRWEARHEEAMVFFDRDAGLFPKDP